MLQSLKYRFLILLIALLMTLSLAGCSGGSYKTKICTEQNTNNSMQATYSDFEGYKFTSIKLKNGDELNLNVNVTTKEGNLKIILIDENGNELFKTENPKEQVAQTIKINKDGTYKIKVQGKHQGSYNIAWNVKKS